MAGHLWTVLIYVCTYMYIQMCVYIHVYEYIYIRVCVCIYIKYIYIYIEREREREILEENTTTQLYYSRGYRGFFLCKL